MIETVDLVGGAPCAVDSTAATEVAAVGIWYAKGSRDEGDRERGSSHFIEHMVFKGTRKRGAFEIAREIDRLGGSVNAFTEREAVSLFAVVPSDGFEKAAEILADMSRDAAFDPQEFERERAVIENELSAAEDDPEEVAADAYAELLWPDHALGRRIGGTIGDVAKLDRDATYSRYRERYAGAADFVSVAGDVDASRVKAAFDGAFDRRVSVSRSLPGTDGPRGAFYRNAPFQHVQLFCSFKLPGTIDRDAYYALQTANVAVGDSMSSRLFQSLRERRGLCYSVYSAPTLLSDQTLWTVYASATVETMPSLVAGLAEELASLRASAGLASDEIDDAKSQLVGGMKLASMDVEHRMRRLARQRLYGIAPASPAEASRSIQALGVQETNSALLRFFDGSEPLVFAVGPARAKTRFLKASETFFKG